MLFNILTLVFAVANAANFKEDGTTLVPIEIDSRTGSFRDHTGIAYVFHGANVVVKSPPYIPDYKGRFDP